MSEEVKPTADVPLEEAVQELTGFEVLGIQKRFGTDFEKLGGLQALIGTVWALENRQVKTDWSTVERMTIKQLNGYFPEREPDPEGEQGEG